MKRLTYWVCEALGDSREYNMRARTKKEVLALTSIAPDGYGPPIKVSIDYIDTLGLLIDCLSEGGASWEWQTIGTG